MTLKNMILIVADGLETSSVCERQLEALSLNIITARDVEEAINLLQHQKINLLLADAQLLEWDGFRLLSTTKEMNPEAGVIILADDQTLEKAITTLQKGGNAIVIKPGQLGTDLADIVTKTLEKPKEIAGSIDLQTLQPLFDLGNSPLLGTTGLEVETATLRCMRDILNAQAAGFYVQELGEEHFKLISGVGNLPAPADLFWESQELQNIQDFQDSTGWMIDGSGFDIHSEILSSLDWSSLLAVILLRKKERYLFLAGREKERTAFQESDLDKMRIIARQAVALMENVRLFRNVAGLVQRAEQANGLYQQAEKMRMIEKILPGFSHEINNPLQSLKNNLYLATRQENRGDRQNYYLGIAQQELYRLEGMLQRLFALTGPACTDNVSIEMEGLVKQVIETLANKLREEGVAVKTNYARPMPAFQGSRDLVEQVLFHLLLNSLEALKESNQEKTIWLDAATENGKMVIDVEDSGPGFSDPARAHLFQPYFSTRTDGFGLGLVVSQRIVSALGGKISPAQPKHGSGAHLRILLPWSN